MSQKKSSNDETKIEEEKKADDIEVVVEGESPDVPVENAAAAKAESEELPKQEDNVEALRKQINDLKTAQELANARAAEAERLMAQQVNSFKQSAEQSQYDSIVTAMGAAQIEVETAKRDIMLAGASQDYAALADAQERLATAKAHMISLEQGKQNYEYTRGQQQQQYSGDPIEETINQNQSLSYAEKSWLMSHKDALTDTRKNARLNAAYFDAIDSGLQRGSPDYFAFIEERLGYRQSTPRVENRDDNESSVMVAAPPNRSVPANSGTGGGKTRFTLTKEEAEIAKLSGITPAEYVKQRELLRDKRRENPDDYPRR